jgi:uncharacterized protein (TIGR02117 family)
MKRLPHRYEVHLGGGTSGSAALSAEGSRPCTPECSPVRPRDRRTAGPRRETLGLVAGTVLVALVSGCAGPVRGLYPPAAGDHVKSVWVVNHGWHTGVAVRRDDIPEGVWPEHLDFPRSEFIEVGWGNEEFYVAPRGTVWLALKAVVRPTPSVLHLVAFGGPVGLRARDIVELRVSEPGFRRLAAYLEEAYARDALGRAVRLGPGQDWNSRFYRARERYFLLKTCNTWTAEVLRTTGAPITPLYALTAGNVMAQVGRLPTAVPSD